MPELTPTPGQTIGPFFHYGLPWETGHLVASIGTPGAIRLHGRVLDGHGDGLQDAMVEIWQADADGHIPQQDGSLRRDRDEFTFTGFGRAATRRDGYYSFSTVAPGPTRDGAAAFFAVTVFARGLLNRLFTRAYLPGDETALSGDALLTSLEPERRSTLLCVQEDERTLRFDIRLQGEGETVFLSYPRHQD